MISADNAEASILSSSTRVGLEGSGVETSNLAEILFEFLFDDMSTFFNYV